MNDLPPGTISIEIRGIYDGVSVYKLPDGTLVNRWKPDERPYAETQDWIERYEAAQLQGTTP
jgi:hypothetical protein